jgi:hypothetical protein
MIAPLFHIIQPKSLEYSIITVEVVSAPPVNPFFPPAPFFVGLLNFPVNIFQEMTLDPKNL